MAGASHSATEERYAFPQFASNTRNTTYDGASELNSARATVGHERRRHRIETSQPRAWRISGAGAQSKLRSERSRRNGPAGSDDGGGTAERRVRASVQLQPRTRGSSRGSGVEVAIGVLRQLCLFRYLEQLRQPRAAAAGHGRGRCIKSVQPGDHRLPDGAGDDGSTRVAQGK